MLSPLKTLNTTGTDLAENAQAIKERGSSLNGRFSVDTTQPKQLYKMQLNGRKVIF